ncbi:MAG: hypothetical protein KA473_01210 [Anaerolineales bacterium]|nr:hypothetical protein [Anaerolineales bacterium]
MQNTTPIIQVNPKKVFIGLVVIIALLIALSIWGQYLRFNPEKFPIDTPIDELIFNLLRRDFYVDQEANIPTYFNTMILFIPSVLFAAIAFWKNSVRDKFKLHWVALSIIFLYLSLDEAAALHEQFIKPVRAYLNIDGGWFYFAWIIPGMIMVGVFALSFLRFFLNLENKYKILFLFSLVIYVGGIIGGEMLSGYFAQSTGLDNFKYSLFTSLEESLEYFGCSLLIYSLLSYLKDFLPQGFKITT